MTMLNSVLVAMFLAAPASPRAQSLANARALIDDFQFDRALAVLGEVA